MDQDREPTPKTCILCRHLQFDGGEEDYSEQTPGYQWILQCKREHFYLTGTHCYEPEFRATLLKAETCADFEKADLP